MRGKRVSCSEILDSPDGTEFIMETFKHEDKIIIKKGLELIRLDGAKFICYSDNLKVYAKI